MKKLLFSAITVGIVLMGFNACQDSASDAPVPINTVVNSAAHTASTNGTAIASQWMTVPKWSATNNTAGYALYRYTFTGITALTKDIIDSGAILVYSRPDGGTSPVFQVPFQRAWAYSGANMIQERWNYEATVGQLMIVIDPSTNGYPAPPSTVQVRYVFIPSTATGRKAAIDYNNYELVKQTYGLKD